MRCGKWRAFERWSYETHCGDLHDLVCDYCHYDAHIQGRLPVTDDLRVLADLKDPEDEVMAIELDPGGSSFLRNLLEDERRRVDGGAEERKNELRSFISAEESELADDDKINEVFENYVVSLPLWERPRPGPQTYRLYSEWEGDMRQELAAKKDELAKLEAQPVDKQLIINNARTRLLKLLEIEATKVGLLPPIPGQEMPDRQVIKDDTVKLVTFLQLGELGDVRGRKINGSSLRVPDGREIAVKNWADLLAKTAEWLVSQGLLTENTCPFGFGNMRTSCLINRDSVHPSGRKFHSGRRLSNGLHIECNYSSDAITRLCGRLVTAFGQDPAQFHVRLS